MLAIILAAGNSSRMGTPFPKTFLPLPAKDFILNRIVSQLYEQGAATRLVHGLWAEGFLTKSRYMAETRCCNPDPESPITVSLHIGLQAYPGRFVAICADLVLRELPDLSEDGYYNCEGATIMSAMAPIAVPPGSLREAAQFLGLPNRGDLEGVNCNTPEDYARAMQAVNKWQ